MLQIEVRRGIRKQAMTLRGLRGCGGVESGLSEPVKHLPRRGDFFMSKKRLELLDAERKAGEDQPPAFRNLETTLAGGIEDENVREPAGSKACHPDNGPHRSSER